MQNRVSHADFLKGMSCMLASTTFLATSFFLLQLNLNDIHYFLLIFYRFFLPLIFVWIYMIITTKKIFLDSLKNIKLHIMRVICVVISQYSLAFYMITNSLLDATVLLNISPILIPILERMFLKYPIGKSTMIGGMIAFIGVILVLSPAKEIFSLISAVGIIGAFGQAGSQVLYGLRSKEESLPHQMFYLFLFGSMISSVPLFFVSNTTSNISHHQWVYFSVFLMAVCLLGNQIFRGYAYRFARPSMLSPFLYFSILVSALLDIAFFHEIPTTTSIIGAILVIIGGIIKIMLRSFFLKQRK